MEWPSPDGVMSSSPGWAWNRENRVPRFHSTVGAPLRLNATMWNGAE